MDNIQKSAFQALSQDLYRIAIGRHRGQVQMAERFAIEAKSRIKEIGEFEFKENILISLDSDEERSAEDLLMYSSIIRMRTGV